MEVPAEEALARVADFFRWRRYGAALPIINAQIERNLQGDSFLRTRFTLLQVVCNMKLGNWAAAAAPLDALPIIPSAPSDVRRSLSCSSDHFHLHLLASFFPLCIANVARQDVSALPRSSPSLLGDTERLYALLSWTHRCIKLLGQSPSPLTTSPLAPAPDEKKAAAATGGLTRIWEARRCTVARCLHSALTQLKHHEAALQLVNQEFIENKAGSCGSGGPPCWIPLAHSYLMMRDLEAAERTIAKAQEVSAHHDVYARAFKGIIELYRGGGSKSLMHEALRGIGTVEKAKKLETSGTAINFHRSTGPLAENILLNNLAVGYLFTESVTTGTDCLESFLLDPAATKKATTPLFAALRNLLTLYEFAPRRQQRVQVLRSDILDEMGVEEAELVHLFKSNPLFSPTPTSPVTDQIISPRPSTPLQIV